MALSFCFGSFLSFHFARFVAFPFLAAPGCFAVSLLVFGLGCGVLLINFNSQHARKCQDKQPCSPARFPIDIQLPAEVQHFARVQSLIVPGTLHAGSYLRSLRGTRDRSPSAQGRRQEGFPSSSRAHRSPEHRRYPLSVIFMTSPKRRTVEEGRVTGDEPCGILISSALVAFIVINISFPLGWLPQQTTHLPHTHAEQLRFIIANSTASRPFLARNGVVA